MSRECGLGTDEGAAGVVLDAAPTYHREPVRPVDVARPDRQIPLAAPEGADAVPLGPARTRRQRRPVAHR